MTQSLLITGATPDDPLIWAIAEADTLTKSGTANDIGGIPRAVGSTDQLTVIVPGDRVATRRIPLPVKGDKALSEAARLAFEDVLSGSVEDVHFAFGDPDETGARLVSAMPVDRLEDWLDAFEEVGLDPDIFTVDHLALWTEGYETITLEWGAYAVARLPQGGLSGEKSIVRMLMDKMDRGGAVLPMVLAEADSTDIKAAGPDGLVLTDERALAAFYLSGFPTRIPPSFRRGAYAKRRDWVGITRPWRLAAGLMAACFGMWLLGAGADGLRHQRAAETLRQEATAQFTAAFPGTVVRDLRRQAAQRAGSGSATGLFLRLSVDLTAAIEQSVAIQLTGLTYTEDNELVADLRFPDAASLERLKALLEDRGVVTREGGNLRREDNGDYSGRLFLGGRG